MEPFSGEPVADDDRSGRSSFTLVELSEVSGVPARTIRFCIAIGLLPPPLVAGRSACYGEQHLKELDRIKTLQGQGQTLAQIAWQLGEGPKEGGSAESQHQGLCGSSSNSGSRSLHGTGTSWAGPFPLRQQPAATKERSVGHR